MDPILQSALVAAVVAIIPSVLAHITSRAERTEARDARLEARADAKELRDIAASSLVKAEQTAHAVGIVQAQTDGALHLVTELAKKEGVAIGTVVGRAEGRAELHQEQAVTAEAVAAAGREGH